MEIIARLKEAGLTGNEAKVYLELLQSGSLSANRLAKNIGMDRTLAYTVLNHLIEKGQVRYIIKKNKKVFSCTPPNSLLNPVREKEALIKNLIGDLEKTEKKELEETEVTIYEGKEGVRNLLREILKEKKVDAFGSTGRAYDLIFESPDLAKEAEKRGVIMRVIASKEHEKKKFTKHKNLLIKFLDVDSEATTSILNDRISIHLIKGKPITIVIKNKHIVKSYKNYFEWMWKNARD